MIINNEKQQVEQEFEYPTWNSNLERTLIQDFDEDMNGLNGTISSLSLNETKDSEMIEENFNQNVSTLSNLSLEENQESKMAENIMIQNGGAGIGKPMGSLKFDDFLKKLPIKFPDPCKVPQLFRRKKAKSN